MENKVVLITGGSQGIGRAVALSLAKPSMKIAITYVGNKQKADDTLQELKAKGADVAAFDFDLLSMTSVKSIFTKVEGQFGQVDALISNAYGQSIFKPHMAVEEAEFDQAFGYTKGTFFLLQEAANRLKDGGSIVVFSTGATAMATPAAGVYSGSKSAIEKFAFSLAKEIGGRNINVNVVSPGVTQTESLVAPQEMIDQLVAQTPFGRLGKPEDVASAVETLISEKGHWINMQNIGINGGIL